MDSTGRHRVPALTGATGNERLTTVSGLVLVPLFIAELLTLLALGALLSVHIFVGLWLAVPLVLKLASTGYRFARYYTHDVEYVEAGPPRIVPRLLAPILVIATVALIASGVALWAYGPPGNALFRTIHKVSFQVWWLAVTAHVLLHLGHIRRDAVSEFVERQRGYVTRGGLVVAFIIVGLMVAASLMWVQPSWPVGSAGG